MDLKLMITRPKFSMIVTMKAVKGRRSGRKNNHKMKIILNQTLMKMRKRMENPRRRRKMRQRNSQARRKLEQSPQKKNNKNLPNNSHKKSSISLQ